MTSIPKEVLRKYKKEWNFKNPNEVLSAMKEMFTYINKVVNGIIK